MANRYWVGGTGTWDTTTTTHWSATSGGASGASVPTAADSVYFDQAATYTVTMTGALLCLDYNVSAGIVTFALGTTPTLVVSGSMSLITGTIWNNTGLLTFNATTAGKTITTNSVVLNSSVTLNGVGGTWALGSALTLGSTNVTSLVNGTLDLNNYVLTTGLFASSNTNARSIIFGTSNIVLAHSVATTVLSIATATGFTYTGSGGFTADASIIRTYNFGTVGGTSTNAPNLTLTGSGTAIPVLTTGSWFNKLDFGTTVFTIGTTSLNLNSLKLSSGASVYTTLTATMVGTGSITSNGNTTIGPVLINSTSGTTTLTSALSCTTFTLMSGTIDFATFNLTCSSSATHSGGTILNLGTIFCTTYSLNTTTFTMASGAITTSSNFNLGASGVFNYNGGILTVGTSFVHSSGTVNLGQALALSGTGTYTFTLGSLNLNNYNLTVGTFSSSNPNARSIAFGSGNIILAHTTASQSVLGMSTAAGFTWTGTGGFSTTMSVARIFTFGSTIGGSAVNAPNLLVIGGSATANFSDGSWFNKLDFTGHSGIGAINGSITASTVGINVNTLVLSTAGTYTSFIPVFTRTQIWTAQFSKQLAGIGVNSIGGILTLDNTQTYVTNSLTLLIAGTLDLGGYDLTTGMFLGSGTNTRTLAFGTNNIILAHATAATTVLAVTDATNFTYTGTGGFISTMSTTRTFTFGDTAGGSSTNSPNITLVSGTSIATLTTGSWFNKFDFGTTAFLVASTVINFNTLILSSTGTFGNLQPTMVGTGTLITNGKNIGSLKITSAGTTTVLGAITTTSLYLNSGIIDFAFYNITISGVFSYNTGSILNLGTISCVTVIVTGAYTLTQGTITASTSFTLTSGSFNFNGGILTTPIFTHTLGTVTLGTSLNLGATNTYTLTAGTLDLGGFNLTTGIFSSNNANTRSILFGTGNIFLTTTVVASTVLDMLLATGFTCTGTGSFSADASITRTYTYGTASASPIGPNLSITSGSAIPTFTNSSNFNTIDFTGSTCAPIISANGVRVSTLILAIGGTYTNFIPVFTRTQTWIPQFSKQLGGIGVYNTGIVITLEGTQTYTTDSTLFLTQGTIDLGGYDLNIGRLISSSSTRSIIFGTNNIILTYSVPGTVVLSMASLAAFTWTGTGGFITDASITKTITCGSSTAGALAAAPNLALSGTGISIITFTTASCFNKLDFGTTAFNPGTTALNLNSLTLSSGGSFTTLTPTMVGTGTIINNGNITLPALIINSTTGITTLGAAFSLTTTGTLTLTSGTLNLGGYDLTIGIFSSIGIITRSVIFGTNNIILVHPTAATTVLSMSTATAFTCTGSGGFTTDASITRTLNVAATAGDITNAPNMTLTGSGTAVITIVTTSYFNKLDFGTTVFNPGTTTLNLNSVTLSSGGTFNATTINTVGTGIITPNGNTTLPSFYINAVSGTTTLAGALTIVSTGTCQLASGTLNLAGYNLTTGIFIGSGTATKSLAFGTGNIILVHPTAAQTVLSMDVVTNFTYTGSGGFIADANITRTYTFGTSGGTALISPNLTLTGSGTAIQTFITGSWFNKLDFGTTAFTIGTTSLNLNSLILSSGGVFSTLTPTMVGTGSITTRGNILSTLRIDNTTGTTILNDTLSLVATGTATLTSGTLNLNNFTLTTGIFNSNNSNTRSIIFGTGNIILAHTTAATTVLGMNTTIGLTCTGSGGFITDASITRGISCGNTAATFTNVPNLTLTTGTSLVTISTGSVFNKLDLGTTSFTIAGATWNISSLILSPNGTFTGLTANLYGTGSITSNGKSILALTINNTTGITTLNDALSLATTGTTTLTSGTLNLNNFTLTTGIFSSSNSTARSIIFGTGNIVLTYTTAATTVLSMSTLTNFTCSGTGGFTSNMSVTRTFSCGSTAGSTLYNVPNLYINGGTSIPTITNLSAFNTLDFTGSSVTDITAGNTVNVNSLILSSGGVYTSLYAKMMYNGNINTLGKTVAGIYLDCYPYTTTSVGDIICNTLFTLTSGILNLAGFTLTTAKFTSTGSVSRSIIGTNANIVVNGSGATAWTNALPTGISITGIIISMISATAKTFAGGDAIYPTLNQGGAGALTITGNNTFDNITNTYSATGATSVLFTGGSTNTFNNFNLTGTVGKVCTLGSTTTTQANLQKSGPWFMGTNSTNTSNNTGLNFTAGGGIDYLSVSYIKGIFTALSNFFMFFR